MNFKNLDEFYKWVNEQDYEDKKSHITNDLIKIRDSFKENPDILEKIQWEINFFQFRLNDGNLLSSVVYTNGIEYPDIKQIDKRQCEYLKERLNNCQNIAFKARYANILWLVNRDYDALKTAIDCYMELAVYFKDIDSNNSELRCGLDALFTLKSAFYLSLQTGKARYKLDEIKSIIKNFIYEYPENSTSYNKIVIDLIRLIEEKKKYFALKDFENLENICWDMASKHINQNFTFGFIDLGQKIDRFLGKTSHDWLRKKAEYYELLMNQNNLWGTNYCTQAIKIYKQLEDVKKVKELEKKYTELAQAVELQEISTEPIDISELIKNAKKIAKNLDAENFIKFLIGHSGLIPEYDTVAENTEEFKKNAQLASLVTHKLLDSRGNIRKIITEDEEKENYFFFLNYDLYMQIQRRYIDTLFIKGYLENKLNYKNLIEFFINNSWYGKNIEKPLPNNKSISYSWLDYLKPALFQYFTEIKVYLLNPNGYYPDFILPIDSLTLKIEGIIRDLLETHEFSTFKISERRQKITTEEDNLNNYLYNENIFKILSKDLVYYLRWLFIETENLRNEVSHCLLFPQEYTFSKMHLILLAILRLSAFDIRQINK